jgi:hypothetical protein
MNLVQIKNPGNKRYILIDKDAGRIVEIKSTRGPYIKVPIMKGEVYIDN